MICARPRAVLILLGLQPTQPFVDREFDFVAEGKVFVLSGQGLSRGQNRQDKGDTGKKRGERGLHFDGLLGSSLMMICRGVSMGGTAFSLTIQIWSSSLPFLGLLINADGALTKAAIDPSLCARNLSPTNIEPVYIHGPRVPGLWVFVFRRNSSSGAERSRPSASIQSADNVMLSPFNRGACFKYSASSCGGGASPGAGAKRPRPWPRAVTYQSANLSEPHH